MRSRSAILSLTILAAASGLFASERSNSYIGLASIFSVPNRIEVPGKTLPPGEYSVLVVDQYSDRMTVKVQNEKTKDYALFLGVPQPGLGDLTARGPVDWQKGPGGATAIRGYAFAPGSRVEFVYPKDEAVQLATKNAANVIAVDPASEGMPPLKNMSKDDMRMVSLWALSLTTVGPKDKTPAILAKKYEGEHVDATQPTVAKAVPAAPPPPSQAQQVATLEQPKLGVQSDDAAAPAPARRRPVIAKLPHTASPVALIAFCGIFCLTAGVLLRLGSIAIKLNASNA